MPPANAIPRTSREPAHGSLRADSDGGDGLAEHEDDDEAGPFDEVVRFDDEAQGCPMQVGPQVVKSGRVVEWMTVNPSAGSVRRTSHLCCRSASHVRGSALHRLADS